MAREINLIGYSKGVDDFISNGMSMQRTIPYSGDDAREHHEQKLLPGLSISAGEATEYDGPFAVKMTGDTTLYVNPGNAYNNGSLLAQWEGGELSLPEEVADGIWRVVVYPETGTLKCGLASGYLYFQFAELAMVTVEDGKIKSIAEKWERGHLYLSFYLGMFSVIRYTDTSVWVNPGSVRNGGKAYAEYPGGVVELSSQEDGRLFLYAIPDQGGVTVVMSSTSLDYAFKMIATIRVREGKIYSIVQDWDDGVIASELSSAVFAMTRYSDTSVSINAGSAMCYGNNSNLTYENVRFEENGETVLLDLGGLGDGTYYIVSELGETMDIPTMGITIDRFHATPTYPARVAPLDVVCGYVVIANGKLASIKTYGHLIKYLSIYYGAFALMTDGKKVKMLGGSVSPGGTVPDTILAAKDSYVSLVISYDAESGYSVKVRQDTDQYYVSTEREVAVRIGSIGLDGDYVHVFQQWTYGNIQVLGRVL